MNRTEARVVANIDRKAERSAERGRLVGEAREHVAAFLAPFHLADEKAEAADALAQAIVPVLSASKGAVAASLRCNGLAGRYAPLPRTKGGREWR